MTIAVRVTRVYSPLLLSYQHPMKSAPSRGGCVGRIILCVLAVIFSRPGVCSDMKGIGFEDKQAAYETYYTKSFAVCIGINDYESWPDLSYAEEDARAMAEVFRMQGFDVNILLGQSATRKTILRALGEELAKKAGSNDRVVIYFSGHGQTESLASGRQVGYIIPVDCPQSDYLTSAISMTQLREIHDRLRAKHILYLMDSCYSGQGFLKSGGIDPNTSDYVNVVTSRRAVQMITAGDAGQQAQEGEGHGLFTEYVLRGLKGEADIQPVDGVVTVGELGLFVERPVFERSNGRQRPRYGRLDGEGEVVFVTSPEKRIAFASEVQAMSPVTGKAKGSVDIFGELRKMDDVRNALARRKDRLPKVEQLFSAAAIGLEKDGMIVRLPFEVVGAPTKKTIKKLFKSGGDKALTTFIDEENSDRRVFVHGMAVGILRAGAGDEGDPQVLKTTLRQAYSLFHQTQHKNLNTGWFFRTPAGTWDRVGYASPSTDTPSVSPDPQPLKPVPASGSSDRKKSNESNRFVAVPVPVPVPIPVPSIPSIVPNLPTLAPSTPHADNAPSNPPDVKPPEKDRPETSEPKKEKPAKQEEKPRHPDDTHGRSDTAARLIDLGDSYLLRRQFEDAETSYIHALRLLEDIFGPVHPDVARTLDRLSHLYESANRADQAKFYADRAKKMREKAE